MIGGSVKRLRSYLAARLSERSTWVGFGAVITGGLTQFGSYLSPTDAHRLAGGAIACGVVAILIKTSDVNQGGQ